MDEPGSPVLLAGFARWCRSEIDAVVADDEVPSLLFAHGPYFADPICVAWLLDGQPPDNDTLIRTLAPAWIGSSRASQIGLSLPFGRPRPGVTLVAVDELEAVVERSYLDLERLRLERWDRVVVDLPLADWQRTLAVNAGFEELAKWHCRRCGSVCPGEAEILPTPCDFCGSTAIERVPLATPLRDPKPPWDASAER